jgi:hypothetical protein
MYSDMLSAVTIRNAEVSAVMLQVWNALGQGQQRFIGVVPK